LLPLQREATVLMAVILEAGNLQVSQSWSAQTLLPGLLPASYLCTLNTSIPVNSRIRICALAMQPKVGCIALRKC